MFTTFSVMTVLVAPVSHIARNSVWVGRAIFALGSKAWETQALQARTGDKLLYLTVRAEGGISTSGIVYANIALEW